MITDLPLSVLIVLFSLVGGVLSLVGGFLLLWKEAFTKRILLHLITFAAGTLLTVAILDLLPESLEASTTAPAVLFGWTIAGIVVFFVLELFLRRHHHQLHAGEEAEPHSHTRHGRQAAPWLITIGDGLHNFIDGVAITAGFLVSIPTGIVTALAVAAHEIPQEISDFSVLLHAGWSRRQVIWWNVGTAMATTVGAVAAYLLRDAIAPVLGPLLAFAAGIFIYIAASDLIPEIHAQSHNQEKPSHVVHVIIALLLGVLVTGAVLRAT